MQSKQPLQKKASVSNLLIFFPPYQKQQIPHTRSVHEPYTLVTHLLVFTQTDGSHFTVDSRRAKCEERRCSRRGASSRRSPPCTRSFCHSSVLITASAYLKPDISGQKPQLWCDKFIFSKRCNPMLHCCCRSPAFLTQAERSVDMKEHLLLKGSFWIIIDYGGNSFEGSYFPVANGTLQSF